VFLSAAVGYFAMIIPRYGFFGLGAFFGVIITMILDELFIGHYDKNHIIFWVLSCVLGVFFIKRHWLWSFIFYLLEKNGNLDVYYIRIIFNSVNYL